MKTSERVSLANAKTCEYACFFCQTINLNDAKSIKLEFNVKFILATCEYYIQDVATKFFQH